MRWLVGLAAFLCLGYVAIGALLYSQQSRFLYPAPDMISPLSEGFEEVSLTTEDGLTLRAFYRAAQDGKPTAVYFHGNGGTLYGSVVATEQLAKSGYGLLLPEYRGYGGNPGQPSEKGFYADGRAALSFLEGKEIGPDQLILMGNSIGGGTAVQLASETDPKALILTAPFTSLPDVASEIAWWLPVQMLLSDRFENSAKIAAIDAPILIQHGSADSLIPNSQGQKLATLNRQANFELFDGEGHDLIFTPAVQAAQVEWLAGL